MYASSSDSPVISCAGLAHSAQTLGIKRGMRVSLQLYNIVALMNFKPSLLITMRVHMRDETKCFSES